MFITILVFILILTLLVFVHELGHYAAARKAGVKVDEFGFGLPPRICGWQRDEKTGKMRFFWGKSPYELLPDTGDKEESVRNMGKNTIWSLNWIPIGGFVKIKGEGGEYAKDSDSFATKSAWWRATILTAGVAMNIVLSMVLLSVGFMIGIPQILTDEIPASAKIAEQKIQVTDYLSVSPAREADIRRGDALVAINGEAINSITFLQDMLADSQGEVVVQVSRGSEIIDVAVMPELLEETGNVGIGVALADVARVSYPFFESLWRGVHLTGVLFIEILIAFGDFFANIITQEEVMVDVAGPVGIAVLTGQVVDLGFIYVLQFAALLSLNLAIINYLPFPALDGGQVVLLVIEKIRKKPIALKTKNIINNTGFLLLLGLIFLITIRDIAKLLPSWSSLLQNIQSFF